jgi:ABC-type glutathione transport system ATPase component
MARKSEVYTWRLSPAVKAALEEAARRKGRTVSELLDEIVAEKLQTLGWEPEEEEERQRELHERAASFAGCFAGGDRQRATNARAILRDRVKRRVSRAT